jgi:hypothetical protein
MVDVQPSAARIAAVSSSTLSPSDDVVATAATPTAFLDCGGGCDATVEPEPDRVANGSAARTGGDVGDTGAGVDAAVVARRLPAAPPVADALPGEGSAIFADAPRASDNDRRRRDSAAAAVGVASPLTSPLGSSGDGAVTGDGPRDRCSVDDCGRSARSDGGCCASLVAPSESPLLL